METGLPGRTPYLSVISPSGDVEQADIAANPFLIGRQDGNHLVLRDNRISRLHARIFRRGPQFWIEDCGSKHGLVVNGVRVANDRPLREADTIEFGSEGGYRLTFGFRDSALPALVDRMPGGEHIAKLRALVEVARALHGSLSPQEVLGAVLDAAMKLTGSTRGFLLEKDATKPGDFTVSLARDNRGRSLALDSVSLPMQRIRELLSSRVLPPAVAWPTPSGEGVLCVPLLRVRTEISPDTVAINLSDTAGAIFLELPTPADLSQGNRELLETLAAEASAVLENAALLEQDQERRRMEQELEIARGIQRSLLPKSLPATGWLRVAASTETTFEVGGDFYDVIPVRPNMWSLVMADVSGKGASAALLASLVQGAFLMAPENTAGIVAMLEHLNRYLYERTAGEKYATVFYAALEQDGLLRWANAGHVRPFLLRASGAGLEELDTTAMPVGMLDPAAFAVSKMQLRPGDKLIVFSDGLADASNAAHETFDRPFRRWLKQCPPQLAAAELHREILRQLQGFTSGLSQPDDITLLVAEYAN